jgi:cell wall assembly regulator SMI1
MPLCWKSSRGPAVWRELIERLYDDAEFAAPASDTEIDQIELRLGQTVPETLRELLRETNGVLGDSSRLVWSAQEIIRENAGFRQDAEFAALYMSFDQLMFMADNGGGDQFAHVRVPRRGLDDVFVWDHESDTRQWVANSLQDYLQRRAGSNGDDWYK